jgi:hypothetical protein
MRHGAHTLALTMLIVWIAAPGSVGVFLRQAVNLFIRTPRQSLPPPEGWKSYQTFVGDVDGDGKQDLVWNAVGVDTVDNGNYLYVGFSNGDGSFTRSAFQSIPSNGNWKYYQTYIGDVNGDGRQDLIWNSAGLGSVSDANYVYVGLSNGDGSFERQDRQKLNPSGGWGSYQTFTGDVNGDDLDDLIWNSVYQNPDAANYVYIGLSNGDGTFTATALQSIPSNESWYGYKSYPGDFNGDGKLDLIWNSTQQSSTQDANYVYVGFSNGDGSYTRTKRQTIGASGWKSYQTLVADVNGDGADDLIWNSTRQDPDGDENFVYTALSNGDGTFQVSERQIISPGNGWSNFRTLVGDVTCDGKADLIWNSVQQESGDRNLIYVGVSNGDGIFTRSSLQVVPPDSGWSSYKTLLADLRGRQSLELVWNSTMQDETQDANFVYAGLANCNRFYFYLPLLQN